MRKWFRHCLEALEAIANSLLELRTSISESLRAKADSDALAERVGALELGRGLFEADMEGLLAKCEGKMKAANNAEARERTMRRQRENFSDGFDNDFEEAELEGTHRVLPPGNATSREEEPMHTVHVGLASSDKTLPLRMKFLT